MATWNGLAMLLMAGCLHGACVSSMHAQDPPGSSRDQFLSRVDRALAQRDAAQIAGLADVERWRTSGHADLRALELWLPLGPLKRTQNLSANEVLYEDGEQNSWRLRLRHDAARDDWAVTIVGRPCPPKGMPRGRPWEEGPDPPAAGTPAASGMWTVLECWPLPK
jgi:hypothetical protein